VEPTIGQELYDPEGNRIGTLTDLVADPMTLEPEWLTVNTSRVFGRHERLVPYRTCRARQGRLEVPFAREHVHHAPKADPHIGPTSDEREELVEYYRSW
jgi:hypothetical protein